MFQINMKMLISDKDDLKKQFSKDFIYQVKKKKALHTNENVEKVFLLLLNHELTTVTK